LRNRKIAKPISSAKLPNTPIKMPAHKGTPRLRTGEGGVGRGMGAGSGKGAGPSMTRLSLRAWGNAVSSSTIVGCSEASDSLA